MISEEQIQRFFAKRCTPEEGRKVAAWLKKHPEEAAAFFDEAEWQNASTDESVMEESYAESWQHIQRKIKILERYHLLKRSAVAACILGCIATSFFYLSKNGSFSPALSSLPVTNSIPQVGTVDTECNLTSKPRRIAMADGSVVSLSPKSVVWFDTPFARLKTRDVYLKGEARFEVAKNKLKPFTVYSRSFSTTALGTEFIVNEQSHNIRVLLMHGKVVIKNIDHSVKNWENVYLLPGQQMTYHDNDALAKVSVIQENKMTAVNKPLTDSHQQRETADSLIFNGSDMKAVLQQLHRYYNVNIQFSDAEIKHISFTGVIVKKDSLQTILNAITQMNGLSVKGTDSSFIISKGRN